MCMYKHCGVGLGGGELGGGGLTMQRLRWRGSRRLCAPKAAALLPLTRDPVKVTGALKLSLAAVTPALQHVDGRGNAADVRHDEVVEHLCESEG